LGGGDLPPKTVEDYKVNVPAALAEQFKVEDLSKDPMLQAFMKDAHAAGMSQKQVDLAIGSFLERAPGLALAARQLKADECTAALKGEWKTDADYKAGIERAYKAGETYGGADFEGILKDYGNDPRIVRLLSNVGKELGEDRAAPAGAGGVANASEQERLQLAGWLNDPKNRNDPLFATKNARYSQLGVQLFGDQPRRTAGVTVNTV